MKGKESIVFCRCCHNQLADGSGFTCVMYWAALVLGRGAMDSKGQENMTPTIDDLAVKYSKDVAAPGVL